MRGGVRRPVVLFGLVCALALLVAILLHGHMGSSVAGRPSAVAHVQPGTGRGRSATVQLAQPRDAPDVLSVRLRPGLRVRYLMDMPSMPGMGTSPFDAQSTGRDTYSGMVIFPMAGRTRIVIQVRSRGRWQPVWTMLYDVDGNRIAHARAA